MTTPKTPGQAGYEARQVAKGRRMGAGDDETDAQILAVIALGWDELPPGMQADEEAGAQAVRNAERERIRQQAINMNAYSISPTGRQIPFEEFLRRSPEENAAALLKVVSASADEGRDDFTADPHRDLDAGENGGAMTDADYYDRTEGAGE